MKKIMILARIFVCIAVASTLWSCKDKDEPTPPPTVVERTVLVYMVAANNLGQPYAGIHAADSLDIQEMQLAAGQGKLGNNRWIIYHSTATDSRLYEVKRDELKMLKEYDKAGSSVSIARMQEVIDDTRKFAPANSYGMVLWSHATGWIEDGVDESEWFDELKPMSYGSHFGKKMNLTSLDYALRAYGFDFLYFDCCLMGSVEVAYQLRNDAKYIIASPSELPRDGMRYDLNMSELLDGSRDALIRSAKNTFDHYSSQPRREDRTCTMSVYSCADMEELAQATADIYALTPMKHPLRTVTNYYGNSSSTQANYLDFGEYVDAICETNAVAPELVERFNAALSKAVVFKAATPELWSMWPLYNTSGFSTRVFNKPADIDVKGYDRLDWTNDVVTSHPEFSTIAEQ